MIAMQSLIRPSRHAGLQQDEAGADFLDERPGLLGQDQVVGHEHVAELHAIGAGAVHGEERLARLQRDRGIGAIGEEHHDLAGPVLDARRWCRRNGRGRGWRPRAARRARRSRPRPCGPSISASRSRRNSSSDWKARCRRAPRPLANVVGEVREQLRIGRIRRVPDQRVLAPRHEGGGAADLADRRHRLDGAAQIGRAILRVMAAPGPGIAETPQQFGRIDRAASMSPASGASSFRAMAATCVGDRRRRQIALSSTARRDAASEPITLSAPTRLGTSNVVAVRR